MKSLSVFRSAFHSVKDRYSLLTLTVLGLTIGVCVYFFYFLSVRADQLDERHYRVLNRIENKIDVNLSCYLSLVKEQTFAAKRQLTPGEGVDSALLKNLTEDSVYLFKQLKKISFLQEQESSNRNLSMKDARVVPDGYSSDKDEPLPFIQQDPASDSLLLITGIVPLKMEGDLPAHIAKINFNISVGALVRPLLRYDHFDQFMIVRNDTIIYETFSTGLNTFASDTIAGQATTFNSGTGSVRAVYINGENFRAYQVGFVMGAERGWRIVGLKSADKFATEKHTLPRTYLFAIFIAIVFVILAIPFIKSMIMSRTERLGTVDAIFSAISLAVATSIICLLVLDGYMRHDLHGAEQTSQLDSLSVLVEKNLATEIDAITEELVKYSYFVDHKSPKDYEPVVYPGFNNLFLINSGGLTFRDHREPEANFDVHNRDYFKNVIAGQHMNMKGVDSSFFLDAVISFREQQFRATISVPAPASVRGNQDLRVAALTTRMRALTAPVLPSGTGFCIFDADGNVLFHSDSTRSLNENIIEECGNSGTLRAAINGRAGVTTNEEYAGLRYVLHVRPLNNLPYFIATFSRRTPVDAIHGQVFGMAFVLQVLLFLLYVVVIFLGFIIMHRKTRLQIPAFSLSVFTPLSTGNQRYLRSILFNVFHAVIMAATACLLYESLSIIILFFVSAPYTVFCNMLILSKEEPRDFLKGKKGVFLLGVYAALIIAANVTAFHFVDDTWLILLAQIVTAATAGVLSPWSGVLNGWKLLKKIEKRLEYKAAYAGVVFLLVMITCVLPVMGFAVIAFNKEQEIQVKTAQLHILNQLVEGSDSRFHKTDRFRLLTHYYSPFFGTSTTTAHGQMEEPDHSVLMFDAFSAKVREQIQDYGEEYNKLRYGSRDSLWTWRYRGSDSLVLAYKNNNTYGKQATSLVLVSEVPFFRVPFFGKGEGPATARFWLLLIFLVTALYLILAFFVRRIFAHEKYSRIRARRFDQVFFSNQDPDYKVFVTGLPGAGKSVYFRQFVPDKGPVHVIDFMNSTSEEWNATIDRALKTDEGLVLLDHFEHDITSTAVTKSKLELIEKLVAKKNKRVIIVSSIQPSRFLSMLRPDAVAEKADEIIPPSYERWSRVLAAFYDFCYPLQGYATEKGKLLAAFAATLKPGEKLSIPPHLIQLVEQECEHGLFLSNIGLELLRELQERKDIQADMTEGEIRKEREDMILRIQRLADNYYRSVWNHLGVEEQFVLYDLAQDGLVNSKNLDIVEVLIDKGLVIYSNKLRTMNRNFRNFVLSIVDPADLGKLEKSLNVAGAWSKFKLPLFFVVFTLLLFVLKSDGSPLFSSITGFTAIIPIAVAILSLFSQVKKKE